MLKIKKIDTSTYIGKRIDKGNLVC